MSTSEVKIDRYVSSPVLTIGPGAGLADADAKLAAFGVSCLAVTARDQLLGVISRSDLLRVGRRLSGPKASLLELPNTPVSDEMVQNVVTVELGTTVRDAAAAMVAAGIHRVFVTDGPNLVGVFSTRDVMLTIRDGKYTEPISASMSSPIFSIGTKQPISMATELLDQARVSGVLVTENGWPVGLFTQIEALESQAMSGDTPVDEVMNPALVCLPKDTRMHRAAGQANALRVRRVVAVDKRDAVGILSGLDFARFAAE